jgi:hypothetical protein
LDALSMSSAADAVLLHLHLDPVARGVLFRCADAVLADNGHEPFGERVVGNDRGARTLAPR